MSAAPRIFVEALRARVAAARVERGSVYVGVEWDDGFCERELTEAEARALLVELEAAIREAYG